MIGILRHLAVIKILCFTGTHEQNPVYEVLLFCNVSIKSHASVVFLRVIGQCGAQTNPMNLTGLRS